MPPGYRPNTITDAAEIRQAGYRAEKSDALRNMPVVPDKSVARSRLNGESAALQRAWYHGKIVKHFSFNEASLSAPGSDAVPLSIIYVSFNRNPDKPNGGRAPGFVRSKVPSRPTTCRPRSPGIGPTPRPWLVNVYDNAD